jgi:hypothetical protein
MNVKQSLERDSAQDLGNEFANIFANELFVTAINKVVLVSTT